jgi:hypothetical protein
MASLLSTAIAEMVVSVLLSDDLIPLHIMGAFIMAVLIIYAAISEEFSKSEIWWPGTLITFVVSFLFCCIRFDNPVTGGLIYGVIIAPIFTFFFGLFLWYELIIITRQGWSWRSRGIAISVPLILCGIIIGTRINHLIK